MTDDALKALLASDRITAVTVDTNVFVGQRLNLNSAVLKATANLSSRPFQFVLSGTVAREVQKHLEKNMEEALRAVKKSSGDAILLFGTSNPKRDELLAQITGGRTASDAAEQRLKAFLTSSSCEVLDDSSMVDTASIFDAYFSRNPPFSQGKKTEFPDALALQALDSVAKNRRTGILVVSEDSDWRAFCEKSSRLYWVAKLEKALALINDAPIGLRRAVIKWFSNEEDGRAEVGAEISRYVEGLDVEANADASSGSVETHAWSPELESVEWPNEADIDIIQFEEVDSEEIVVTVSLGLVVNLRCSVELSFSIWDSIDKESLDIGGRTVTVDRSEDARVIVDLHIRRMGSGEQEVEILNVETSIDSMVIDLGEVDVFEDEDYEE